MKKETRKERRERAQKRARTADSGVRFEHDGEAHRFDGQSAKLPA